ncbi:hypothetical protein EVAR_30780_1 [Eumeta japonica]|uniref:Uncharacterized protein n=1 Tax=Eumeta variegata TaxID=151549 RepID=A0A4C1V714_EUMVA|nr:hypothetical protein EVAR_30780_1 [Eumeta japonica]
MHEVRAYELRERPDSAARKFYEYSRRFPRTSRETKIRIKFVTGIGIRKIEMGGEAGIASGNRIGNCSIETEFKIKSRTPIESEKEANRIPEQDSDVNPV